MRAQTIYYFPDEADEHERCFMQWPVNQAIYRDMYFLRELQKTIANIANTIAEFEPVVMLMNHDHAKMARRLLSERVEIWDIPTDDLWARDSGPVFVQNRSGEQAIRSLNFNGWGQKQIHHNDGKIAGRLAEVLDLPFLDNGLVGEAGGVERAPDGVLLANRSSWVNSNRNAQSEDEVTKLLLEAFGGAKMIWSNGVYDLDITDDHIDATARFLSANEVLIQLPKRRSDPFSRSAHELYELLKVSKNSLGERYSIHVIDEPYDTRIIEEDFVASYANFYLCNDGLIMAEFGDRDADEAARAELARAFPKREIVVLNVDVLGQVGGGIHCATQQQPKKVIGSSS